MLDRFALAAAARSDPYWRGARVDLLLVAAATMLLALVGIAADEGVSARRRRAEHRVLRALGATSSVITRALVVERLLLTAVGVVAGIAAGVGVAVAIAPLVIRAPGGHLPYPSPTVVLPGVALTVLAVGTLSAALVLTRFVGARAAAGPNRREAAAPRGAE